MDQIECVIFSPDNRNVAASGGNRVIIWAIESGKEILSIEDDKLRFNQIAFSPDGLRIVGGSRESSLSIWDTVDGHELLSLKTIGQTTCLAYSADGQRIVSGDDRGWISVWDASTGQEIRSLSLRNKVSSIAISLDGERIVFGFGTEGYRGRNTYRVWNLSKSAKPRH